MITRGVQKCCIVLLLATLMACNTDDKKKEKENDDDKKEIKIQDTMLSVLQKQTPEYDKWINTYDETYMQLSSTNFTISYEDDIELLSSKENLNNDFFKHYGKLLVYNKDSLRVADAYSYGWIADGSGNIRKGEPDDEVAVIDMKDSTRTRILFCGSACVIHKAIWLDEHTISILGLTDNNGDEVYTPAIWIADIKKGKIKLYEDNDKKITKEQTEELSRRAIEQAGMKAHL